MIATEALKLIQEEAERTDGSLLRVLGLCREALSHRQINVADLHGACLQEATMSSLHVHIGCLEVISPREVAKNNPEQVLPVPFKLSRILMNGEPIGLTSLELKGDMHSLWTAKIGFFPEGALRKQK